MQTIRKVLRWIGWPIVFLALWAVPLLANDAVQAPTYKEGRYWRFEATTTGAIARTTDQLNGQYEVIASGGELQVFQLMNGERWPAGPESSAELKRMIGIGQDQRQYLKFPLEKTWEANEKYRLPGWRPGYYMPRTIGYEVIADQSGSPGIVTIQGNARVNFRDSTSKQKWDYAYSQREEAIIRFAYDSNVEGTGAKINIKLIDSGYLSRDAAMAK
jgi:hypothetical protein